LKKAKVIVILCLSFLLLSVFSVPAFADYQKNYLPNTVYKTTWVITSDFGYKTLYANLIQRDYTYYYASSMSDYYRYREAYWDYNCYGGLVTWWIDLSVTYYNGGTQVSDTIWSWPDPMDVAYYPIGTARVGGGNTDDRWFSYGYSRKATTSLLFSVDQNAVPMMRTVIEDLYLN
jgi:hypothetical protein